MSKQEEIREGIYNKILSASQAVGVSDLDGEPCTEIFLECVRKYTGEILADLHSQGVVIKGKILMTRGEEPIGFAVVPLIGDK